MNCYYRLANGIVLQAVLDYRKSLKGQQVLRHISVDEMKKECEDFFTSEWFSILTKIDGKQLIRKLQEEHENESKSRRKYKRPHTFCL